MKNWVPLESNPELLTEYARKLGMPEELAFHEVLSFEDWAVDLVPKPVRAAIFLYPLTSTDVEAPLVDEDTADVFFTRQTIGNACGTIAILHILANSAFVSCSFIDDFVKRGKGQTPVMRARLLEDSEELDDHHAAAAGDALEEVDTHFIAFIEKNGKLIALDGRKSGPIDHGNISDFLPGVIKVVLEQFVAARPDEVRFSLLALA